MRRHRLREAVGVAHDERVAFPSEAEGAFVVQVVGAARQRDEGVEVGSRRAARVAVLRRIRVASLVGDARCRSWVITALTDAAIVGALVTSIRRGRRASRRDAMRPRSAKGHPVLLADKRRVRTA